MVGGYCFTQLLLIYKLLEEIWHWYAHSAGYTKINRSRESRIQEPTNVIADLSGYAQLCLLHLFINQIRTMKYQYWWFLKIGNPDKMVCLFLAMIDIGWFGVPPIWETTILIINWDVSFMGKQIAMVTLIVNINLHHCNQEIKLLLFTSTNFH